MKFPGHSMAHNQDTSRSGCKKNLLVTMNTLTQLDLQQLTSQV
jgi:hypothetical protein